ncbi:MAG: hypothetical protein AUJ56_03920 [Zetaproteobacteria bacterium CG1_02_49_23]|nr:MAG: hypothetical protein AUJ56_03920 [Zetaproteobacteria bacterium CG1_02_49_23]
MNFFHHQALARKQTRLLIVAYMLTVLAVIMGVYVACYAAILWSNPDNYENMPFWNSIWLAYVGGVTALIILSGSIYKIWELRRGGGAGVAEMFGGKRVPPNTEDLLQRRLLNVVEEMAIASGMPVPPVYLLPENGINAFAAGFSSSDAVLGVTQGAIDLLNRDQLQGVLGHEFSHILNADIAMNMRLMGSLHGITLLGDAGWLVLRSMGGRRHSGDKGGAHPAVFILAVILIIVSGIGSLAAGAIKAAISRQREFLADASAVQFTRNPDGLAGALKIIGGYASSSSVTHAGAAPASFMFFGNVLRSPLDYAWFSTHPAVTLRIQRLDPSFDGSLPPMNVPQRARMVANEASLGLSLGLIGAADLATGVTMGRLSASEHPEMANAAELINDIPLQIRNFSHDPCLARALVYALLLCREKDVRAKQIQWLEKHAEQGVFRDLMDVYAQMKGLKSHLRIPILDMCMPALKSLSKPQYHRFISNVQALIRADGHYSGFEFVLQQILLRHLAPAFSTVAMPRNKYRDMSMLTESAVYVVAFLACTGGNKHPQDLQRRIFYQLGLDAEPLDAEGLNFTALGKALQQFEEASPEVNAMLLQACEFCVLEDGQVLQSEYELLRAIADALGHPMPLLKPRESAVFPQ